MTDRLPERWTTRDLPFLTEAARRLDAGQRDIRATQLADELDMSREDALAAASALVPSYLEGEPLDTMQARIDFFLSGLTERGRRAVGLWPSGESADALVDALRQAEEATDDPEEKSLIRRAAGAVGGVSRDIMTDVMASVISRQINGA